jgi:hypothetical protein
MSTLNAVSAFIHDQLGKTLKDFFHREGTFQEPEDGKALSSLVGISSREGSLYRSIKTGRRTG